MNHIITHYTGELDQPGIHAFIQSTCRVDATVWFFTSNPTVPDRLRLSHVRWLHTEPRILPHLQRHYDMLEFMTGSQPEGRFFVCDCRDLVFLGDPFQLVGHGNLFHVFQECIGYTNRDEYYNMRWIDMLGPGALDRLGDLPILCGGTVLAECRETLEAYLRLHTTHISRCWNPSNIDFNDQATFNDVVRFTMEDWPNLITHVNEQPSLVYTMGNVPDEEYSIVDGRIHVNGFTPPVIHQFDRRHRAFSFIGEMFDFWPKFPIH